MRMQLHGSGYVSPNSDPDRKRDQQQQDSDRAVGRERDRGKAVLLSSHDISQSLMLADQLWLITTDRQVLTGAPADLIKAGAMDHLFTNRSIHFNPTILDYSFK